VTTAKKVLSTCALYANTEDKRPLVILNGGMSFAPGITQTKSTAHSGVFAIYVKCLTRRFYVKINTPVNSMLLPTLKLWKRQTSLCQ